MFGPRAPGFIIFLGMNGEGSGCHLFWMECGEKVWCVCGVAECAHKWSLDLEVFGVLRGLMVDWGGYGWLVVCIGGLLRGYELGDVGVELVIKGAGGIFGGGIGFIIAVLLFFEEASVWGCIVCVLGREIGGGVLGVSFLEPFWFLVELVCSKVLCVVSGLCRGVGVNR